MIMRELQSKISYCGPCAWQGKGSEWDEVQRRGLKEALEGGIRGKAVLGAKLQEGEDKLKDTRGGWTCQGDYRHWGGSFRLDTHGVLEESPTLGTS